MIMAIPLEKEYYCLVITILLLVYHKSSIIDYAIPEMVFNYEEFMAKGDAGKTEDSVPSTEEILMLKANRSFMC
jgi:hypothetical protein